MIILIIFLSLLCIASISGCIYLGRLLYLLNQKYEALDDGYNVQTKQYLKDFANVVKQLQEFCANSVYLEFQPEVKKLLIYLRSFAQRLSTYVHELEEDFNKIEIEKE